VVGSPFTFGWKDENIHVLFANGSDWTQWTNPRYQASTYSYWGIESITDDGAYYADVVQVFDELAEVMTDEDWLFVFVFDHGWNDGDHSYFNLMGTNEYMQDSVFATLVDACPYNQRIFIMQQCNGGGFIDDLANENTYIMTASSAERAAFRADDDDPDGDDETENEFWEGDSSFYHHGEMDYHALNALRLITIIGNPLPEPDTDDNGLTSLHEMWHWVDSTMTCPLWPADPQESDSGGLASSIYLNIPPYTPTGFRGERINNTVHLSWNANGEYDLDHCNIYKRTYEDSTQTYTDWYLLDQVTATSYTDSEFVPTYQGSDTVWYKIAAVDDAGSRSDYSEILTAPGEIRTQGEGSAIVMPCASGDFRMENYPNPANPRTVISYTLPEAALTSLTIYDVCGREVASLTQAWEPAGSHRAVFNGSDLSSGIYLVKLTASGFSQTQKLVLLK